MWGSCVIPPSFRQPLLAELHHSQPGIVRMKAVARSHFWWPKLDHDIKDTVCKCHQCVNTWNAPQLPHYILGISQLVHGDVYIQILPPFMASIILSLLTHTRSGRRSLGPWQPQQLQPLLMPCAPYSQNQSSAIMPPPPPFSQLNMSNIFLWRHIILSLMVRWRDLYRHSSMS